MSEAAAQTDGQQIASALPQAAEESGAGDAPSNVNHDTHQQQPQKNGTYYDRVDLSGLPEDIRIPIEGRFAHLSRLMKKNEIKSNSEIAKWQDLARQQHEAIEELRTGVTAVVDHLGDKGFADAENQIKAQMRAAHESGDTTAFIEANDKLAELKAKKAILSQQKQQKPKTEPKQQPRQEFASGNEIANDAFNTGDIDEADVTAIGAWISEKDETDRVVRPWAYSKTPHNPTADPVYRRALVEMAAVFDEASPFANRPMSEKLAELDRRMGTPSNRISQSVMGGNLTMPRKNAKIELSEQQKQIALKTKFGGPKAKTDQDHFNAYLESVKKVKQKGKR